MTWGVTDAFLSHFGLASRDDLPGIEELKAAGLLDRRAAISIYAGQANDEESLLPPDEEDAAEEEEALEGEGEGRRRHPPFRGGGGAFRHLRPRGRSVAGAGRF